VGSSTILDIIGSFVTFGVLFLMALRLNASTSESSSAYYENYLLQSNLTTIVTILEDDFSKIGYCADPSKINPASLAMRYADTSRIRFWTDIDNNGTVDSIEYYIGPLSELSDTPNPRDRYLYRKINNQDPYRIYVGLTQFRFQYRRPDDEQIIPFPITNPQTIGLIELSIALESASPRKQEYMQDSSQYQIFWKQIRLTSKNLKYR